MYNHMLFLLTCLSVFVGSQGLNEACHKNSDCNTKGSICVDASCICDELSYYNKTQCLPYATEYGAFCTQHAQCEWLGEHSDCINNRCICQKSFRWYRGKCQAYVDKGEKCDVDEDCYNGYDLLSLACKSGVCTCSQGYYDRGPDCRKSSMLIVDGDCALDIDCQLSLVPFCALGKCVKNDTIFSDYSFISSLKEEEEPKVELVAYSEPEEAISCEIDADCKDVANSMCNAENSTCACNRKTHYLYNGNCVPGLKECRSDSDCRTSNSMCFKNTTCICKQGFFLDDNKCTAELGVNDLSRSYQGDNDCPIKPGKLVDSTCYCKNYWFNGDGNRNCIKTMIQSTHSCLTNEWCYAMGPHAFCNSTSGQCACAHFARFNESTYYCDPVGEPGADVCVRDSECNINEYCVDEKCDCIADFVRNADNVCVPNIGASCLIAECGHIANASCISGRCKCHDAYIGKVDRCLKIAENLMDSCEEQEQCQNIEHAVCGASEDYEEEEDEEFAGDKCVCGTDYTAISDKCYQTKRFGDPCVTESDCILVLNHSYQCRNSICQCAVGQKLKNGYCTSSGAYISANVVLLLLAVIKLGVS